MTFINRRGLCTGETLGDLHLRMDQWSCDVWLLFRADQVVIW